MPVVHDSFTVMIFITVKVMHKGKRLKGSGRLKFCPKHFFQSHRRMWVVIESFGTVTTTDPKHHFWYWWMSVKLWQENERAKRQFVSVTQIQLISHFKKFLWIIWIMDYIFNFYVIKWKISYTQLSKNHAFRYIS
jgi:hypothetical protein